MVDTRASRRVTRTIAKGNSRSSSTNGRFKKDIKPTSSAPGDSEGNDSKRLEILDLLLDSNPNNPVGTLGSTAPTESTDGITPRTTELSDRSESAEIDSNTKAAKGSKAPQPPGKRGRKPGKSPATNSFNGFSKSSGKRESDPGPEGRLSKKHKGKVDEQLGHQLRDISKQLGSKNPQVYQHLNQLLKNICTSTDKIYSNYLTAEEAFVLLAKDVTLLSSSLTPKKGAKASINVQEINNVMVQNELMNVLYEKLVLVIIYTCKNKVDSKVIDGVAKLIYKLTNEVHERIVCLNAKDNEQNQNKLLLHIWDVLLVLIYCKEKRLRINFTLFLETFVRNACLDEVVINSQLYKKHINALLNLMSDGYSQVYVTSLKLLQSFQAPEVLNILLLNLEHPEEDIRHTTVQILDIVNFEVLESLILKLTDTSAKVRSAIYAKLGPLLSSIPTAYMLYVFNRALKESGVKGEEGIKGEVKRENSKLRGAGREGGVMQEEILGFYEAMTAWITELGLVGYVELLMGTTLQLEVVLSVMVKYFSYVTSRVNRDECGDKGADDVERIYNELVSNKDNLLLMYVNSQLTGDSSIELHVLVSRLRGIVSELSISTSDDSSSSSSESTENAETAGESRSGITRFNSLDGKIKASDSGDEDSEKMFKLVNNINLVLKMLAPKLAKGDLSIEFQEGVDLVEGSDGALETMISIQSDLKRLLVLLPMKFITVSLIDEYVKMTNMDSDYSLNSSYLIVNNPVYYLLLLLNMLNASSGSASFSSIGRLRSSRSDGGGFLTRANTFDSADVVLETLKDIYDPFELNDIKNIRIVINDLKVVRMSEIESYNFKTYSLDHLMQFSSQLQGQLKVHQDHHRELLYMLNDTNAKGNGSRGGRNVKARKNKLDEEIRQNVQLMNKQQRLLYKIKMEINNRHLHILVIIYVYLNVYSLSVSPVSKGSTGSGFDVANGELYSSSSGVNSIFNIYIMPILTSFSTSNSVATAGASSGSTTTSAGSDTGNNRNTNMNRRGSGSDSNSRVGGGNQGMSSDSTGDTDGESGGDEDKDRLDELEYYNNTIVLMCLCIYNIVTYPQTSSGFNNSANISNVNGINNGHNDMKNGHNDMSNGHNGMSNGNSSNGISKFNEKNASLYKELGIYYVLLNNLISMLDIDMTSDKSVKKSPTRSSIGANTLPVRDNDIYIYKLEIILKIIVDLLHLLHANNGLAGTSGSAKSGSSAKGGSKAKSRSSERETEGNNSGVNEEVVDGIFEKMLEIMNGTIKINGYVHSIVMKLLVKTVPMVNTPTLLTSYTVCMLELLLFVPPGISSNARGPARFTGATASSPTRRGLSKRGVTSIRPMANTATGTANASNVAIATGSCSVTLGDLDRLVLFNVISNLYSRKYELVNQCIGEVISTTFKYLLSGDGMVKEDVLCRFKFFFIYLFNVHRNTAGASGNSTGNSDHGSAGNVNASGSSYNNAGRCENDIYGHVASIVQALRGAKYVNINDLLFLVQYLLNTTTGVTFADEGRSGSNRDDENGGDSESARKSNKQLLYMALKRYYDDNHKHLKSNKLVKLVLDQLSFSVDTSTATIATAAAFDGGASSAYPSASDGYADADARGKMYRTPTPNLGSGGRGTTPYCKFLYATNSGGKTPSRSVRRSRRRQESLTSEESCFTVTSDTTELTEITEETFGTESEDSETSNSEY
ncbi:hypothetical protein MACJ_002398 [Theileria orientalis]|uniref:Uncharacterized protein n=1 Tax=Theileria orientalis TaxID=68886 RepID=A0A976QRB9_THEOR|nr:hypothetical protein MACJ_002398 [Theileria orientalis]